MPLLRLTFACAALLTAVTARPYQGAAQTGWERSHSNDLQSATRDLQPPHTLLGVIANLKLAWDRDITLNHSLFINDDLLTRLSGGTFIVGRLLDEDGDRLSIWGFEDIAVPNQSPTEEGLRYFIARDARDPDQVTSRLQISFLRANPSLTFEAVQNIFGLDWKPYSSEVPASPHMIVQPATDPHGNMHIVYDDSDTIVTRRADITFRSDGLLNVIDLLIVAGKQSR